MLALPFDDWPLLDPSSVAVAEVANREGKSQEAQALLQRLSTDFLFTEFGRRASARLRAQR